MPHKSISVVVPAFNAEKHIRHCLQSLVSLDYPSDRLEIIVVDNGSSDRTGDIIGEFPVDLVVETKRGASAARNAGVARAQGDIVAFTDSDCVVEPDWVKAIDAAFDDPTADAVMGFTGGIDENIWAELEQANFEAFWFETGDTGLMLKRSGIDTRNAAIRKSVFHSCGGFDVAVTECMDLDLSIRLRSGGHGIVFDQRIRAAHLNRTSLRQILSIKARHGHAYGRIIEKQPLGFACPHLPIDIRQFLWFDMARARSRRAIASEALLMALGATGKAALRILVVMHGRSRGLTLKIFKTVCAIEWNMALLRALREPPR